MDQDPLGQYSEQWVAGFHPAVSSWFYSRIGRPTEVQLRTWQAVARGENVLLAAPTGSGKTLAAFLGAVDRLFRLGEGSPSEVARPPGVRVLYVSPLKALTVDIATHLEVPCREILDESRAKGLQPIRVAVRTGDTPEGDRQRMLRSPPDILATTPESLYLLLTAPRAREILSTVDTVIIDEIHALARDKRGAHLALSLERLERLCAGRAIQRIGLSATQRPIERVAKFLVGAGRSCTILDSGHRRALDLEIVLPQRSLEAVCSHETWDEIFAQLERCALDHRTTVVFVNTRRLAERVGFHLGQRLGAHLVASHHGSLSKEIRLAVEGRLRAGELRIVVATASLELGIDIGHVDLVCQIGSPRSIATFLQRIGRAGHALGRTPKGRLFPLTRDELHEAVALLWGVEEGRLDEVEVPRGGVDILVQQIVAEAACGQPLPVDEVLRVFGRAGPFEYLDRSQIERVLVMLETGWGTGSRRQGLVHWDRSQDVVRAKRAARLRALLNGGAIPELADYRVVVASDKTVVGSVNEDFAIESMAGDIFQLGNSSWRIVKVATSEVWVEDARGAPATIPFWLGEAPGRSHELSQCVSDLRAVLDERLAMAEGASSQSVPEYLRTIPGVTVEAADQLFEYVAAHRVAMGVLPTTQRIVFERFFDESGGMQLIIHHPGGMRVNRAWGLALRKRFCRSFNFELQAAATDNGILLSLGPRQSFEVSALFRILNPQNCRHMLIQALLDAPMFLVRWRWNTTRALAVSRLEPKGKVPPFLQRFRADDLLTQVFPMQTACRENVVGDVVLPDHPLVQQTVEDCLCEAMDVSRFENTMARIFEGRIVLSAVETTEPSPFSHELVHANPYAFLDDAPLEERRIRAVTTRRGEGLQSARDLSTLDQTVLREIANEVFPQPRDGDELHDAIMMLGVVTDGEMQRWVEAMVDGRKVLERDSRWVRWCQEDRVLWTVCEHWPVVQQAYGLKACDDLAAAACGIVRGRVEHQGPSTTDQLCDLLSLGREAVEGALLRLEAEGVVLRGRFCGEEAVEWCERRILARVHRATLQGLRARIRPVPREAFVRFLMEHMGLSLHRREEGLGAVRSALLRLQGLELPLGVWESEVLPARVLGYQTDGLDQLMTTGQAGWCKVRPKSGTGEGGRPLTRASSLAIFEASGRDLFASANVELDELGVCLRGPAQKVLDVLKRRGASFEDDLRRRAGLMEGELDEALSELTQGGWVSCDGFGRLRRWAGPATRARGHERAGGGARDGRWYLVQAEDMGMVEGTPRSEGRQSWVELWVRQLLRRYGILFREVLERETLAPRWWELLQVLRRLECRGEVRGGRFVDGVSGEQYAMPESVDELRRVAGLADSGEVIMVSALDPVCIRALGLGAVPLAGAKRNQVVALRDGRCVGRRASGSRMAWDASVGSEETPGLERRLRLMGQYRHRWVEQTKDATLSKESGS